MAASPAEGAFQEGSAHLAAGRLPEAVAAYRRSLAFDPGNPAILFNPWCDRGYCHFMHVNWDQTKCDSVYDDMQLGDPQRWGGAYAPYLISKFTKGDATSTTIYWLMSTWNPYQVVLMKSTLQKSCNCRL